MMLTVSMTDSHLYQNLKHHRRLKSHSVEATPPSWLRAETTWVLIGDIHTCDVFSFDKDGCQSSQMSASVGFFFQAMP